MSGWDNPDGTPKRPPIWAWFLSIPFLVLGGFSIYAYFDDQAQKPGLPKQRELTVVEDVAKNVVYTSDRRRYGTIHRAKFSVGGYKTSYDSCNGNFWLVKSAIEHGRKMKVWLDTAKGRNRIYRLSVGGKDLLEYEHEFAVAQSEREALKVGGLGLMFVGLCSLGLNGFMLHRHNSYFERSGRRVR